MAADIDELQIKIAADSQSASENVLVLAGSLETLATAAVSATTPLKDFSQALNGLKGFKATGITQTADDLSKAFAQFNKIGTIDNAVQLIDSMENLRDAVSGLSEVSSSVKDFKIGKGFSNSIEQLADALPKLNGVGNVSDSIAVLDSVENLETATAGLRNISDNIRSLKIGTSFDKNLEQLSLAMAHLNEVGDTSAFAGGVEAISQAVERLNNIEVGQGFINLTQASTQWADSIYRMNNNRLGTDFSQGIARIAKACEILNEVDFGGFKRMNEALASLPENVRVSFGASSTEVKELTENLVNLNNTVQSIQASMPKRRAKTETTDLSKSDNAATSLEETASAIDDLTDAAERGSEPVNRFKINLDGIGKGAMKAASAGMKALFAPVTAIGRKFKAASEKAGQFLASIKRIAMYRAVRSILKAITEGFEEGRKNLYYYSQAMGTDFAPSMDKAATAALYLKNSIGAATAPLTNLLVPIIDKAVDHIVELINKFNELTAVLTGASTWTKAVKYLTTWQESLDDADKSAKKLKSTMLGFDELNVIEIAEPASKKSGFDADDYIKMFEEVKTDMSVSSKIPELLMPVKLAWDSQGDNTLKTIKDTWNEILALIGAVGDSVRKVWTNGTGQKSLELILQIVQNIVGTFGELAKGIRKAWEENETGTRIIQATWNVANNLLTVFRDIWGSIREWASGLDWSPLLNAIAGLGEALERLTDPNGALAKIAKDVVTKFLEPLGKWVIEKGLPSAVDLLATSFDALGAELEFLYPALEKVGDALSWITELTFDNISGLADVFSGITDMFIGKEVSDEKEARLRDTNDKMVDKFGGDESLFGKLNKKLEDWGSHGLYDFVEWKKSGIEAIGEIGKAVGDQFKNEWDNAMSETDTEIIPEQSLAAFDKSVLAISAGYKQIGDSASEAYEVTADTKSVANMTSDVSSFKESYKTMLDDWASGVTSMSHGWDDFTHSVKEEWKIFNNDWASGMTSMSNGWNRFTDGIKEKWQTFKDDWASGMTGISTKFSNMWDETKTAFATAVDEIKTKTNEMWNDITAFFENGWLKISGGVNSFVETCSEGWMSFEESISDMWEELESDFEEGWEYIVEGVDNFKRAFSSSLSTIKMNVKSVWSTISSTLSSKWEDFKGFISDYRNNWKTGFNEIKTSVSNVWSNIRDEIGSVMAWQDLKQTVSDYAGNWFDKLNQIRTSVKDTFDKIYSNIVNSKVGQAISDIASNIKETIGGIWGDEASGIKGTFVKISNGLKDFINNLFNGEHLGGIGDKLKGTLNNVIDAFETAVNYIIKGLNYFIENANDALDIHVDIPSWVPGIGGSKFNGFSIPEIPEFTFYKFENGGFPDKGSLFLANEPGNPEMVGKIGGQTAVANNTQIVQAVSKGVYDAVVSAMAQASRTESGKTELHIYLDRQEITAQIEQQQRDNGVGIMGGLVYT